MLDFIITSLCFRISMSELHSDGIGETGCVITALLLPCPYEPQLLNTFHLKRLAKHPSAPLLSLRKGVSRRLLTDISTQQLRAGVSIRVLGGRSTQDLTLESERPGESTDWKVCHG